MTCAIKENIDIHSGKLGDCITDWMEDNNLVLYDDTRLNTIKNAMTRKCSTTYRGLHFLVPSCNLSDSEILDMLNKRQDSVISTASNIDSATLFIGTDSMPGRRIHVVAAVSSEMCLDIQDVSNESEVIVSEYIYSNIVYKRFSDDNKI